MEYVKMEGLDPKFSRLVYGTPGAVAEGNAEEAFEIYERAFSYGFRVFDTAHSYGNGEENLGYWLERSGRRKEIILMDKGCNPGQKGQDDVFCGQTIRDQLAMSLERLKTDYTDLYVLHRDDSSKPVDEIVETLNDLKAQGKIRHFGGSNWTMERLKEANAYAERHGMEGFTVCSPCYGLAVFSSDPWGGSVTISGEQNQAFRDWLEQNQMPVLAYSPLGRGYFSGKYKTFDSRPIEEVLWWGPIAEYHTPENCLRLARAEKMAKEKGTTVASLALAWLFAQPQNIFPIIGSSSERHIREALAAFDLKLTKEECRYLLTGE